MSFDGSKGPPNIDGMTSLKVDNLTYRTGIDQLKTVFGKYGDIGDIYIPRDRKHLQSRGFAFVRFWEKRDAEDAMDLLDKSILDGREIRVQMARYGRPTETYKPRPRNNYRDSRRSYRSRSRSRSPRRRGRYSRSKSRSPRRRYSRSRSPRRNRSRSPSPRRSRSPPPRRSRSRSGSPVNRRSRSRTPPRHSRSSSPKRSGSRSPRNDNNDSNDYGAMNNDD